ncbi:MAG: glycine cleavage system protein H [Chloroflexi bacterium]|nr:glycine cleavage system protein H [Chloroflexota bacterium]
MAQANGFVLPGELYYDRKDHLWARIEGDKVRVGLDMLAQKSAGEVKHLQLKPLGMVVARKRMFGTIEAGKYVGALRAPVSGTLVEINDQVTQTPRLVNDDPYGEGWFVVIDPSNLVEELKELVHGEAEVQLWLDQQLGEYRQKGLIKG